MGNLQELSTFLENFGGWGVAAVCLVIIWRMAKHITEIHDDRQEEMKEMVIVLEGVKATLAALSKSNDRLADEIARAYRE